MVSLSLSLFPLRHHALTNKLFYLFSYLSRTLCAAIVKSAAECHPPCTQKILKEEKIARTDVWTAFVKAFHIKIYKGTETP